MRSVEIAVIGGGITGQLVQHAFPEAVIFDWNPTPRLDKPHSGLTRAVGANYLWAPIPDIPCRSFTVHTAVDGGMPTLGRVAAYKDKVGKTGDVQDWERQFTPTMTGYEFTDSLGATIHFGHRVSSVDRVKQLITFEKGLEPVGYRYLVSTIPLYHLLQLAGLPQPTGGLTSRPIYVRVTPRPPDAPYPIEDVYVNYLSSLMIVPYRYCDRDGMRHYESIQPYDQGLRATRVLRPGKIYPNRHVQEFHDMLMSYNIVTFGRYGSWRPDELVHETWEAIERWKESIRED